MFGRRLRALRIAHGFSQVQLAGTEISPAYLSRLESGARPPTARVVTYLCEKLKVTPASFGTTAGSSLARALATVMTVGELPAMAAVLEEALLQEQEEDDDAVLRWQAQWALARCYQTQGKVTEELAVLHEMTALGDRTGLSELRARSRVRLARRLRASGDTAGARAHAEEGLALAETHDLPHSDVVEALLTLISIAAEEGHLAQARADADRVVGTLSDDSAELPLRLQAEALWTASIVCGRQGDHSAAVATMKRALAVLPGSEDPVLWMRMRLAAASMYLRLDPRDTSEARLRLDEAEAVTTLVGMPVHQTELLLLRCQLAFHEGRFDDARVLSDRLDASPEGLGSRDQLRLDVLRNQIEIIRGDHATAVADLERIAKEAQMSVNVELSAEVWRALAEALKLAEG
ncbi:helix-turn-helix domain-containing protein [Streptomyces sp. NBC_00102]|uniref:helix-turn-helix domain-containing protein n=1 Tax=Streptomyces sp. NBC_00102 TaxID=2975652 RepID=UPI002256EB40|nr:helix-turn-helix domain-containing protein [Streptomyces sp. NBC_00102]MCX5400283.1 helix-turn-helix domain-containing protein [Streptomyces sp. NBC_00102]